LGLAEYNHEINRCTELMTSLGEDLSEARNIADAALELADPRLNDAKFSLQFLHSPREILRDANGNVTGLVVEENTLIQEGEEIRSREIGIKHQISVDTVIFAIGDRVDEDLGLPIEGIEYLKNPNPLYPVDGQSFEMLDQEIGTSLEGIFLAGWSRTVSKEQVGIAHKDGSMLPDRCFNSWIPVKTGRNGPTPG
jgi:ferredoxin--NADP+ reductase